jgi:uncharacterized membrane protein YjgN (DUF898 family)
MDANPPEYAAPPGTPPAAAPVLSWMEPLGLVALSFSNALLRVLTLGLYGFWAKTEVRKRLWSSVRLNGEPLAYTGTGKQLLLGFLFVFGLILAPLFLIIMVAALVLGPESRVVVLVQSAFYLVLLLLWGLGTWRAQRYRLSNTVWRGIRGSMRGNGGGYATTYFLTGLLVPLTLGWIVPWRATRLQGLLVNDMRFGDKPFSFHASAAPLYRRYALAWFGMAGFLSVATFAIFAATMTLPGEPDAEIDILRQRWHTAALVLSFAVGYLAYLAVSAWYRAHQTNHFAAHTRFGGASLEGTMTGPGLMLASIKSFLVLVLSLGILAPVAEAILWRYSIANLRIVGEVDLAAIAQGAETNFSRGEGLAQAFDFDV